MDKIIFILTKITNDTINIKIQRKRRKYKSPCPKVLKLATHVAVVAKNSLIKIIFFTDLITCSFVI